MAQPQPQQLKKAIYLFKNLSELDKGVETPSSQKLSQSGKSLLQSAEKLYKEGKKSYESGDEEQAYILFVRTINLCMTVKNTKEYQSDPTYYNNMMKTTLMDSFTKAEELKTSLKQRYSLLQMAKEEEDKMIEKEMQDAILQQEKKKLNATKINGVINIKVEEEKEPQESIVTVAQLKNLMEQKSTRILVIDCRGGHDFNSSHLNHPNCVSIPQEVLERGLSANRIEIKLKEKHPESYHAWNKRGTYDRVILYDWNSTFENMQSSIQTLYTAMTQWDRETKYLSAPAILQGGIRNLYYTYPMLINHPQNTSSGLNNYEEAINGAVPNKEIKPLNTISYPNWEEDEERKPTSKGSASGNNNTIPPPGVVIDRSTKPSNTNVRVIPIEVENGPTLVNGHPVSGGDTSETKAAALAAALDDAIIVSNELKTKEQEMDDIMNSEHVEMDNMMQKLKVKEQEIKRLQDVIKNKDENLNVLKAEYDAVVSAKVKTYLPQIRQNASEAMIDRKVKEKKELDEYVRQIRSKRKEKERNGQQLPTIPGSGSNSPRLPISRVRSGKSESSATTFPSVPPSSQNGPSMLRPMSQDATSSFQKLKDEPSDTSPARSLLKRSHSHPNIAQSLSEEDPPEMTTSTPQVPHFSRNLKPSLSRTSDLTIPGRNRQFHPVSSTEKQRTGLKNLGNTCYMNSIIQCLYHLPGLVEYFNTDKWKENLMMHRKQKGPTNGDITIEFHAVVQEMSFGHRSIGIMDFKNMLGHFYPSFKGYEQQDSHELLVILLDRLHEELNTMVKSPITEQENDGLSDLDAANKAWTMYRNSNHSRIFELFCGQQKSTVRCLSCGKQSVTFEAFYNLSVPIPSNAPRKVDVYQCIDLYTTEESLSGFSCPHCKSKVQATKKIDLWRLPPYLIIHFQRFYNDGWWKKRLTEVDFPVDNLDLTARVKGRIQDSRMPRANFMLQAVSNHYGSMDGGHYTAYCRKSGNWAKFDDQEVTQLSPRDVVTPAAYILFYCNTNP